MTPGRDIEQGLAGRYDEVYARARGQHPASVPWAHGAPHPLFASWLDDADSPAPRRDAALVIASGLGDDAEELADRGWKVTAFDASPQAIAWTRERFPDTRVTYRVEDLFALPEAWHRRFDLVVEIHTVQALPVTYRQRAIEAIADTVAPGGTLVVITMTRLANVPLRGYPMPLTESELASFQRHGLEETDRHVASVPTQHQPGRVRCVFTRPAGTYE